MAGPHDKPLDEKATGGMIPEVGSAPSNGDDVGLLDQLAEFSMSAGEYSSALEYYEQILRIAEKARESAGMLSDVLLKMARCRGQTGDYTAAVQLLDAALTHLPAESTPLARCRILNERAFALIRLGDYAQADDCLREVTERILDPAAASELARAQQSFGVVAMRRGDWDAASQSLEAALAGYRMVGDRAGMGSCLNNLGLMEKNRGNLDSATRHARAALKIAEDIGETYYVGIYLTNLGIYEFKLGEWEEARDHWERAGRLLEGIGNQWEVANVSLNLGNYYRHKRDWDEAGRQYEKARVIVEELGEARELVLVKEFQGDLAFSSECYDEARDLYHEALTGGEELAPHGDLVLEALRRLADLDSSLGNLAQAGQCLERAFAISEQMNEEFEKGILLRIRARLDGAAGDIVNAAQTYRRAVASHRRCSSPFELAVTRLEYAAFCIENIVDLDRAARQLEEARETFEMIGAEYEAGHAYLLAAKLEMVCDHPTGEARSHLEAAIDLLERVGNDEDQEALREVHRDIDRLLAETSLSESNELAALNAAVALIRQAPDSAQSVRAVERVLEERMRADRCGLFLLSAGTSELQLAPGSGMSQKEAAEVLRLISVLKANRDFGPKPLVSTSPARDPRFAKMESPGLESLGSVVFMPLFSEEEMLGGIWVDMCSEDGYFRQPELDFLVAFATAAAMAVQEMRLEAVRSENLRLRRKLTSRTGFEGIITQNRRFLEIIDLIDRLKESTTTVLLEGETGTGKELLARATHAVSTRRDRSLVVVNCAALSRDVLESELFGHIRGAFTDAKSDKIGLFEKADGGTIFVDEIDKTTTNFQERLLRVVDQGEIKPVGANQAQKIDVRIICASNRSLKDLVESGAFLKDLYYRLRVISIEIPPLRERKEDVPLLAEHFLAHFAEQSSKRIAGFTHEAMNRLVAHSWPGNVRDLRHEVERAVAMAEDGVTIGVTALSPELREDEAPPSLSLRTDQKMPDMIERIERDLVEQALRKTSGNRSHAAKLLGISRRGLLNKISRYSIDL
jgi:transcriptional regulator with GAF, ATPase, and Fis domain/Tfp pilus assembly protein PilF